MAKSITDAMIRAYCEDRGYSFKPWEPVPWEVDFGPSPWPAGSAGAAAWPRVQKLRQKIIEELR